MHDLTHAEQTLFMSNYVPNLTSPFTGLISQEVSFILNLEPQLVQGI